MTTAIILGSAVAALLVLFKLFVRWHVKWLDAQSPVGVWTTEHDGSLVTIKFEPDPTSDVKEGLYMQLTQAGGDEKSKESGHWWHHRGTLRMLMLASDTPDQPRFGEDTIYRITFTGPEEITIDPRNGSYERRRAANHCIPMTCPKSSTHLNGVPTFSDKSYEYKRSDSSSTLNSRI